MTVAAASRKFSRKKTEWVLAFNSQCSEFCTVPSDVCPNGGNIQLMTNAQLRANFEDGCIIRRIQGEIYWYPSPHTAGTPIQNLLDQGQDKTLLRVGMRRGEVNQALGVSLAYNPLRSGATETDLGDFTEARWLWLKEHFWRPYGAYTEQEYPGQCCPDVHTSGTGTNDFSEGTGIIEISTTCGQAEGCPPGVNQGFQVGIPQAWKMSVNYRRPIVLKENEELGIWFGWENLLECGDSNRKPQVNMNFVGGIRLLVEK